MRLIKSLRIMHQRDRFIQNLNRTYPQTNMRQLVIEGLEDRRLLSFDIQPLLDINTALSQSPLNSPTKFIEVEGIVYFVANDALRGFELWKSDGTARGTVLVKDINPGVNSSLSWHGLSDFTNVSGMLFFVADDGVSGLELWRSDGTERGTYRVKDIRPGRDGGVGSQSLINVNGTLFFIANDGTNGWALWKSDGTEVGTKLVKSIRFASQWPPLQSADVGGVLFFSGYDKSSGYELWRSDGTESGTFKVKDINPGPEDSQLQFLTNVNGTLFFAANDGTHGNELWKSDGTVAGTLMVRDIRPGSTYELGRPSYPLSSSPKNLINVSGTLFFSADDGQRGVELWKSNGSAGGTVMVKDIQEGTGSSYPRELTNVNGTLYFVADGFYTIGKSDGTEAGTTKAVFASFPSNLRNLAGSLFFTDWDGPSRRQFNRIIDPSRVTSSVLRITDLVTSFELFHASNIGDILYFPAADSVNGWGLWRSDGTKDGTFLIKRISVATSDSALSSLVNINGTLYFAANDGTSGHELWKTDGSLAGTMRVKDIHPGPGSSELFNFTNVNGVLYFVANDGQTGGELWKSDGTESGTVRVKDILPGEASSRPRYLTNVNGLLFFSAIKMGSVEELWKSDGTTAGTVVVKDIENQRTFVPRALTNVNGTLFFRASSVDFGCELWKSDGTSTGTIVVKDINPGYRSSSPDRLVNYNGILYFTADEDYRRYWWRSDGTAAGTVKVRLEEESRALVDMEVLDGQLYFLDRERNGEGGMAWWKSDGTSGGAVKIVDVPQNSFTSHLTKIHDQFFYTVHKEFFDYFYDFQLWKTDGTKEGTVKIREFQPRTRNSFLSTNLTNWNGILLFTANDGTSGEELWRSDGTEAGTRMVTNIANGYLSSTPRGFTSTGNQLYFSADTPTFGRELYSLRFSESPWTNLLNHLDVNGDGRVSAIDLLRVINYLNSSNPRSLAEAEMSSVAYIDVNGDKRASALDALLVINRLNSPSSSTGSGGEGEERVLGRDLEEKSLLSARQADLSAVQNLGFYTNVMESSANAALLGTLLQSSTNRFTTRATHMQHTQGLAGNYKRTSESQWQPFLTEHPVFDESPMWMELMNHKKNDFQGLDEALINQLATRLNPQQYWFVDIFFKEFS